MLMRTDPFRDLERLTAAVLGTATGPAAMPMDAYRAGGSFVVQLDLSGVAPQAIDLTVEKNVLTVRGARRATLPVKEQAKPRRITVGSADGRKEIDSAAA